MKNGLLPKDAYKYKLNQSHFKVQESIYIILSNNKYFCSIFLMQVTTKVQGLWKNPHRVKTLHFIFHE